ncbi:MAG: ABC transporter permease [Lachnospiraceae bacterium]|nr:ABC transporter permease [Lachnospiraceae bacterium]
MSNTKTKKNKRNAVLFKEMTMDMKRAKIMVIMLVINFVLAPIAVGFFIGIGTAGMQGALSYRVLAWYLIAMVYVEATILLFITPAITAGSVSLEKERQTLDVLLTTRMTPWEIIKGKYFSNLLFLSLMVLSTFPLLAIVFIYGGISFFHLIYIGLTLFVFIAFISCFGVFFSTATKNTVLSVILTYIFMLFYIVVTMAIPFILMLIVALLNEYIYYDNEIFAFITDRHFIYGDPLFLSGTLSPVYMIFDAVGNSIGYEIDGTGIQGMISFCETDMLPHFSEKNLLMKAWTPISMIEMLLITFGVLRLSAVILNPVKGKKRKKKGK